MIRFLVLFCFSLAATAETKFFVLGSGTPNPNPDRSGSAYLVLANDTPYLFDFGPGVVRKMSALSKSWGGAYSELEVENLEYAFLTHFHSDHSLGLADLIITPWIMGRERPLKIFGPASTADMAENIIKAYQPDIDYRIKGTQPQNSTGYKVVFTKLNEGLVYKDQNIQVLAFLNAHGDVKESFGFVIETEDKKILISGDTGPSENLIKYGKNLDILVHEVYSQAGFNQKTPDWQKYHKAHHTSPSELAAIAKQIKPKKLVLSHILFWGATEEEILQEMTTHYSGKIVLAKDLLLVE